MPQDHVGASVELLATMIRNRCVSTDDPPAGSESRNADTLRAVLEGPGLEVETIELDPGRSAIVARISGHDPEAASLSLLSHTDVVPASEEGWRHDPFGGELIDGEVWGRGAVDMLNQTTTMAIAVRRLADAGFRPRGDLVYVAVPDEECGGLVGMKPLIERHPDLVRTDYAVTEVGGAVTPGPNGPLVEAYVADKGGGWISITVRGTPAHSSLPFGADNALVKVAAVVRRLVEYRPPTRISDEWRAWVSHQDFDPATKAVLCDPSQLWDALATLPDDLARQAHACNHSTIVPTVVRGGDKSNVIPGLVRLSVNVRPALDEDPDEVVDSLRTLLADLVAPDDIETRVLLGPTRSSTATPLWPVLESVVTDHYRGATLVPTVLAAQTDARWLRPEGVTVYGFGLLSEKVSRDEYWSRFHGRDERIDLESLDLSCQGWEEICRRFLG
ncbi:MAG: M20/M25/M40 family metallo-hydrolase [Acidimicrobiia bacterium]